MKSKKTTKKKNRDKIKSEFCEKNKINLIRIRHDGKK